VAGGVIKTVCGGSLCSVTVICPVALPAEAVTMAGPAVDPAVRVVVATPLPSVVVELGIVPNVVEKWTVTPGTRLLKASRTVVVTVLVLLPSAGIAAGLAATATYAGGPTTRTTDVLPLAPPAVAVIVAVPVVVAAVKVAVATPLAFVVPVPVTLPKLVVKVTIWLGTRLAKASFTVVVMMLVLLPLAVMVMGWRASNTVAGGPATKSTFVVPTALPAVAVTNAVPIVLPAVRVAVASPLKFVVANPEMVPSVVAKETD